MRRSLHSITLGPGARILWLILLLCMGTAAPAAAASLTFTVTTSEPAVVTGTPRIAIDVGGVTRYASYAAGSGTTALTFSYAVQQGDFDPDGIEINPAAIDLDGSSITDLAGNPLTNLSFTVPDTSALKVQTYTVAFNGTVTNSNAGTAGFTISKAAAGADYTATFSSSGGTATVIRTGTISALTEWVTDVDLSALPAGTLTVSVKLGRSGVEGAASTAAITPGFTGVLDGLPTAAAAFSVRRLRSGYGGPLVRAVRSTDGAELDIGATLGGDLDTAALAGFCGTASCFASVFYDQSGNGNDALSDTAGLRPSLVNAGAVEKEGRRPALRFWGAVDQLMQAPRIANTETQWSFNAVARSSDSSKNRHIMGDRGNYATGEGRILRAPSGGASYVIGNLGGAGVTLPGSSLQQRVVTAVFNGTAISGALNGVVTAGSTNSYYRPSLQRLWIGSGGAGQSLGQSEWFGTISEAMAFNTALSTTNRQTLERNQGAYYGISVQ